MALNLWRPKTPTQSVLNKIEMKASRGQFIPAKSQFYVNDGNGRDTYIYNNNGGFSPAKSPTKIHEVGMQNTFVSLL